LECVKTQKQTQKTQKTKETTYCGGLRPLKLLLGARLLLIGFSKTEEVFTATGGLSIGNGAATTGSTCIGIGVGGYSSETPESVEGDDKPAELDAPIGHEEYVIL
jgi:hypothetical protein